MADGIFGPGGLMGPMGTGMSPFVNPLAIMGAGLYQNRPLDALQMMGNMQSSAAQLAQQQAYQQGILQRYEQEMALEREKQRLAVEQQTRQNKAMTLLANTMFPQAAGEGVERTAAENARHEAMRQAMVAIPGFAEKALAGEIALPTGPSGGGTQPLMSWEDIVKEYNLELYTPESVQAVRRSLDPSQFVLKQPTYGFSEAMNLRGQAQKANEPVRTAVNSARQLGIALSSPGPLRDVAALVGFTKTLDPGSVAQPGEVRLVSQAGGIIQDLRALAQQAQGKGPLLPKTREEMRSLFRDLMEVYREQDKANREYYRGLAGRFRGVSPDVVEPQPIAFESALRALETPAEVEAATAGPAAATVDEEMGKRFDEVLKMAPQLPTPRVPLFGGGAGVL